MANKTVIPTPATQGEVDAVRKLEHTFPVQLPIPAGVAYLWTFCQEKLPFVKLVSIVAGVLLLAVSLVAFVLFWSPGAGTHRVSSPGGRSLEATVDDAGWSWDWGADFYVDLYLVADSGEKIRVWKDRNGQQSIEDARFLKESIKWIGEKEIRFSSRCTEEHYSAVENDDGEWTVSESWWDEE